jgi:hypothetical protein
MRQRGEVMQTIELGFGEIEIKLRENTLIFSKLANPQPVGSDTKGKEITKTLSQIVINDIRSLDALESQLKLLRMNIVHYMNVVSNQQGLPCSLHTGV